ncbi:hypothetical protein IMAU70004_02896 [Lactiplantibacillus plantarum]|uniref:hypothetical protein n=1 Tax=Lactiplantibacillus plantarum TaxID=1590 RepID=UPI00265F4D7F|nr:hypothetical protein [Lactiplantibacillus plantarum]MCG0739826.1 hypothetical protein [Lactiplantibacillus plantarum]MDO1603805.1 hypothetical protein [Lactiplantibacillus plantarum]
MNEEKINQARPKIKADKWQVEDHAGGEDCCEALLLKMPAGQREFSLPLSVVINWLWIAEKEGYVPPLADQWWIDIRNAMS